MRAVVFDNELVFEHACAKPEIIPGWAIIKVISAGICSTDLEIMKGYMGFKGIPGHEFVGIVELCDDKKWIGKRVVGEINAACGKCDMCRDNLQRHCSARTVLGILNHAGCMADYCTLPIENLFEIPEHITNDRAVLIEPLSAACAILKQLALTGKESIVILGDGRLGILCAWVLSTIVPDVTLIGHHPKKLQIAKWHSIKIVDSTTEITSKVDIIVDATGSCSGIRDAMELCRPRGIIVLKSTIAAQEELNLSPMVINELTLIGSRCGRFHDGLDMLESYPDMPLEKLITARYPLDQAVQAFDHAMESETLKVLLEMG